MTRQARLIQSSFDQIRDMPEAVAMLFYGRLFDLDPSLRPMFKGDLRAQATKLVSTLDTVVGAVADLSPMEEAIAELGRKHAGYGVQPAHYDLVRDALLWALGQALQAEFDAETRAAWRGLLDQISRQMIAASPPAAAAAVSPN